jgi:hypothetical protein
LKDIPKFSQIGIFGLKMYHLAILAIWTTQQLATKTVLKNCAKNLSGR